MLINRRLINPFGVLSQRLRQRMASNKFPIYKMWQLIIKISLSLNMMGTNVGWLMARSTDGEGNHPLDTCLQSQPNWIDASQIENIGLLNHIVPKESHGGLACWVACKFNGSGCPSSTNKLIDIFGSTNIDNQRAQDSFLDGDIILSNVKEYHIKVKGTNQILFHMCV